MRGETMLVFGVALAMAGAALACNCYPHEAKAACKKQRELIAVAIEKDRMSLDYLVRPTLFRITTAYQDELVRKGFLTARVPDAPPHVGPERNPLVKEPVFRHDVPHTDHFVVFSVKDVGWCTSRFPDALGVNDDHTRHLEVTGQVRIYCLIHTVGWSEAEVMMRSACGFPECTFGDIPILIDGPDGCPAEVEWRRLLAAYGDPYGQRRWWQHLVEIWLRVPLEVLALAALVAVLHRKQLPCRPA